jgi:hypothetical protein
MDSNQSVQCPKCFGELPHVDATKCMHCGSSVKPSQPKAGASHKSGSVLGTGAHKVCRWALPSLTTFKDGFVSAWRASADKHNSKDQ